MLGLIGLTVFQFTQAPTGFIPQQDQGYLINIIQLPPGASLARTDEVAQRVNKLVLGTPGVAHTVPIVGLDGATFTSAPNSAVIFSPLAPFPERAKKGLSAEKVSRRAQQEIRRRRGRLGHQRVAAARTRHRHHRRVQAAKFRTPTAVSCRSSRRWRSRSSRLPIKRRA